MELEFNGLTIGYQPKINFQFLADYNFRHVSTFRLAKTPNNDVMVILYQWINKISKTINSNAEAFYIENINPENFELAEKLTLEVYNTLNKAFEDDKYLIFDMETYIPTLLEEYKTKKLSK